MLKASNKNTSPCYKVMVSNIKRLSSLFFLVLIYTSSFAQLDPQTIEVTFINWVKVLNTGNTEKIEAYTADHFAPGFIEFMTTEKITNMLLDLHQRLPDMQIQSIQYNDGYKIAALVRSDENQSGLMLNFMKNHKIQGWSETDIDWQWKTNDKSDQQVVIHFIDSIVTNLDHLNLAITIGNSDSILYQKNIGLANRSFEIPIDERTRFNAASTSKIFTTAAIMLLVDQGKLDIEANLTDYLDWDIPQTIKIKHLLQHTSGLPDIFTDKYWLSSKINLKSWHDLLSFSDLNNLNFEPGARYEYSNTGFLLLGLVIEKISGQDYFSFVQNHIWGPLNMHDTKNARSSDIINNQATGYTNVYATLNTDTNTINFNQDNSSSALQTNAMFANGLSSPAGGCYTTTMDLFNLIQGLINEKLITEATLEQFATIQEIRSFRFDVLRAYGNGFMINQVGEYIYWGHEGSLPGANSGLYYFPSSDLIVSILSNSDEDARKVLNSLVEFMFIEE